MYYRLLILCFVYQLHLNGIRSEEPWYINESVLKNALLKNYDKDVIPLSDVSKPIMVAVGLGLMTIDDFCPDTNNFKGKFYLKLNWNDERLSWDPSSYNNISKSFSLNQQDIWIPDVVLFYGDQELTYDLPKGPYTLATCNGDILYIPPITIKMKCSSHLNHTLVPGIDVSSEVGGEVDKDPNEPDEHGSPDVVRWCSFTFGSWVFDASAIGLILLDEAEKIDLSSYLPDLKKPWEIVENFGTVGVKTYPCCPDYPYTFASFVLKLRKIFY